MNSVGVSKIFLRVVALVLSLHTASAVADVENLQPGVWTVVSNNTPADVNPCPNNGCSWSGNEGQAGVFDDWNSGVLAPNYGEYGGLIVWGGGHAGYLGNEVYIFDIGEGLWRRLSEPVPNPSCNYDYSELQDGSPCSAHSGNYLEFHPPTNKFVKVTSSSDHMQGGLGSGWVHEFDLDTNTWSRGQRKPSFPFGGHNRSEEATTAAYDPNRQVIWHHAGWAARAEGGTLGYYDPQTSQWTEVLNSSQIADVGIYAAAAVDSERDLLVILDMYSTRDRVYVYDLSNISAGPRSVNVNQGIPSGINWGPGFAFDPVSEKFVAWGGNGGQSSPDLYTLSVPSNWQSGTWTWTRVTTSGSAPRPNERFTFGRFRYVPSLNAFIVANTVNGPVHMIKLNANDGPPPADPPSVSLNASPGSVVSGNSASLSWSSSNAASCTASGGWSGGKSTGGSESVGPLTQTTSFTLNCTGAGGSASDTAVVTVTAGGPSVELSASPETIAANASTVLSWSAPGATSCSAGGGWSGPKASSGSETVGPLAASRAFTLECENGSGSSLDSVIVNVQGGSGSNDFASRCSGSGVVACIGFDSQADLDGKELQAFDGSLQYTSVDTNVYASGGGSMRQEIPPFSGAAASGGWASALGDQFGPGDTLHVQFRQRFSQTMLDTYYNPGGGWKQVIFYGNASCAGVELTTVNQYHQGFPSMYTDCGGRNLQRQIGGGDVLLQQGDYNCHYQGSRPPSECGYYAGDEWMTFYYEIELGNWDTPTSHIRAYMAYEGGPMKQFVDMDNYSLSYDSSPSDRYKNILLTTYMTGKDAGQNHPTGYTWYDELIVSTQPIPAPNGEVPPPPPVSPPSVDLRASPQTVASGGSSSLSWTVDNATSCSASGGWSGTETLNPNQTETGSRSVGPITSATSYTLTCVNEVGEFAADTVQVSVSGGAPAPDITFYADPTSVELGDNSTLYWNVSNASSCVGEDAWDGNKGLSGSEPVWLNRDVTYSLSCTGPGGTARESVSVTVVNPGEPVINFSANPTTVESGQRTTLTWSAANADSCQASGAWTGNRSASGSQQSVPLTGTANFGIVCTGPGGSSEQMLSVNVVEPPPPPPPGDDPGDPPPEQEAGDVDIGEEAGSSAFGLWTLAGLLLASAARRRRRTVV